ncbi:MAG TPA: hypothetical protein VNU66_04880 [Mycobacteriales bacterium]|nr:hypothetical protein [Mycobacteriales bacterium]
MSRHRTGSGSPSGKGRPTPKRTSGGVKSRPTPTRSTRTAAKGPVYRQRRYPPLPLAWKLVLAAIWVAALVAVVLLVDPVLGQVGIMIAVTAALPLAVVLLRDPSRRRR